MGAIRYTPKAADLPNPNRGQGGSYSELEVPGDYEVRLESFSDYDKTATGGTKGWIFEYQCETPSGGSVGFSVWIPHNQMWKVIQHFDALGSTSEEGESRVFDPKELVGNMAAAHIDFPRDDFQEPTSKYREIRYVFPIPDDADIQEIAAAVEDELVEASVPEAVDLPDEVEEL